jgi:hypothetical protein
MKTAIFWIVAFAALFVSVSAWADESLAVMKEVKGRVELKAPDGDWSPAVVGATLAKDTMISTGFNSQATVALGGSILTVKPITRLTLEDIVSQEGNESVSLYLLAGRVKAEVRPPVGGKTEFKVKSPTATASVRGTEFDFDAVNLDVADGVVSFSGVSGGPAVQVAQGETSYVNEDGAATVAISAAAAAATPPPAPAGIDTTFFEAAQPGATVQVPVLLPTIVEITLGW